MDQSIRRLNSGFRPPCYRPPVPVRRPGLLISLAIGAYAIVGSSCTPPKVIPLCPGFETVECDTRMLCVVVASDGCRECVCERRWYDDSRDPGVPDPALKAAEGEGEGESDRDESDEDETEQEDSEQEDSEQEDSKQEDSEQEDSEEDASDDDAPAKDASKKAGSEEGATEKSDSEDGK